MEEFELEPGETITASVRKHWLVFVIELLPFLAFMVLPAILIPLIGYFVALNPAFANAGVNLSLANPWMRLLLGIWWLVLWAGAFNSFTRYFLDQWVITTTRIVDIHQFGFFRRGVSSFLLSHVQDVTSTVDGPLATLFGFGTLRAETAGDASQNFIMTGIPNPEALRDLIMREIAALQGTAPSTSV